jgi:hypothetical protein
MGLFMNSTVKLCQRHTSTVINLSIERNTMKTQFIGLALALVLGGCATQGSSDYGPIKLQSGFDLNQARSLLVQGNNAIKGNAFMRQNGGGVVTCAGSAVFLIPATAYATERIEYIYGSIVRATGPRASVKSFEPDYPEYVTLTRKTVCDSQGNFAFENVADGSFFVSTSVGWSIGQLPQGGSLMHAVTTKGGQTVSLVLAP